MVGVCLKRRTYTSTLMTRYYELLQVGPECPEHVPTPSSPPGAPEVCIPDRRNLLIVFSEFFQLFIYKDKYQGINTLINKGQVR